MSCPVAGSVSFPSQLQIALFPLSSSCWLGLSDVWCKGEWHREWSSRCNFDLWNGIRALLAEASTPLENSTPQGASNERNTTKREITVQQWMEAINDFISDELCCLLHCRISWGPRCKCVPRNALFITLFNYSSRREKDSLERSVMMFLQSQNIMSIQAKALWILLFLQEKYWLVGSTSHVTSDIQRK